MNSHVLMMASCRGRSPAAAFVVSALVLSALAGSGCRERNPLYCEDNTWCTDPVRPYCDVAGNSAASDGLSNTCVDSLAGDADAAPPCVATGDELCNHADDDCDGATDEGFGLGEPCSVGAGDCAASGVLVCGDDFTAVCDAIAGDPRSELCDGRDNDCDGYQDEDWGSLGEPCSAGIGACEVAGEVVCTSSQLAASCSATPGTPADEEVCGNTIDETCDGSLVDGCDCDPGQSQYCGPNTEQGECAFGTQSCGDDGKWSPCQDAVWPATEICNGKDDDCDGDKDEGFGVSGSCVEGTGECQREGVLVCRGDGSGTECDAVPGQPVVELCDQLDNDCDGFDDEDWPTLGDSCSAGVGACEASGTTVCSADHLHAECDAQPTEPADEEVCGNTIDETCDGSLVDGCECNPGQSQDCGPNSEEGLCQFGTATCGSDGKWGACEGAVLPTAERCSGDDENCNGFEDEGFDLGDSCTNGVGECQRSGALVCSDDQTGTDCDAIPGSSGVEVCDELDNDCDGVADENWPTLGSSCSVGVGACASTGVIACTADHSAAACNATAGTPAPFDTCGNAIDENCDGSLVDGCDCTPGVTEDCGPENQQGLCEFGTRTCLANGTWGNCIGATMPTAELCNHEDDDCNNVVDDGFGVGAACSNGIGACAHLGQIACKSDGTGSVCDATPYPPGAEVCDGIDNDCDGAADEDLSGGSCDNGQLGACYRTGTETCNGAAGISCSAPAVSGSPEICNNIDDDCDGEPDDNIAPWCTGNVLTYCGGASTNCSSSTQACYGGACVGVCVPNTSQCVDGMNAYDFCLLNGEWGNRVTCDSGDNTSWEVCRSADCVDSPYENIGNDNASSWATLSLVANQWRIATVIVPHDYRVFQLNVFLNNVPGGMSVRMAIWDEEPNGFFGPQPGTLVGYTNAKPALNGVNAIDVAASVKPLLTAGGQYWVGVNVSQSGSAIRYTASGAQDTCTRNASFLDNPAATLATFPTVQPSYDAAEFGIYLRGKATQ